MNRVTVILLKRHLRSLKGTPDELVYTGKTTDANKLARLMPVFISFVLANLEYFREAHGYALCRNRTIPGQKAHIFAPFRDAWFPHALREMRAEDLGVPLDDVEETQYLYKKNQTLSRHGQSMAIPCVSAVQGWQFRKDLETKGKKRKLENDAVEALLGLDKANSSTGVTGVATEA